MHEALIHAAFGGGLLLVALIGFRVDVRAAVSKPTVLMVAFALALSAAWFSAGSNSSADTSSPPAVDAMKADTKESDRKLTKRCSKRALRAPTRLDGRYEGKVSRDRYVLKARLRPFGSVLASKCAEIGYRSVDLYLDGRIPRYSWGYRPANPGKRFGRKNVQSESKGKRQRLNERTKFVVKGPTNRQCRREPPGNLDFYLGSIVRPTIEMSWIAYDGTEKRQYVHLRSYHGEQKVLCDIR